MPPIGPPTEGREWGASIEPAAPAALPATGLERALPAVARAAYETWAGLLGWQPGVAIDVAVADLAPGTLAEAGTTKVGPQGQPLAAVITVDADANGRGWFIDATPSTAEEFRDAAGAGLRAIQGSAADDRYDLFTVLLHEMGHALGFTNTFPGFAAHLRHGADGSTTFVGPDFTAALTTDGDHLAAASSTPDLLDPTIRLSARVLPSATEVRMIDAAWRGIDRGPAGSATVAFVSAEAARARTQVFGFRPLDAAIAAAPAVAPAGIVNGGFTTADPQSAGFGWNTLGSVAVAAGRATLGEGNSLFSDLSQVFVMPAYPRQLTFTIVSMTLGASAAGPADAFEVALLDADTGAPLAGTVAGLTDTDSLLNIQADGRVFFASGVTVPGVASSGCIVSLSFPLTVTIDVSAVPASTRAALTFDLTTLSRRGSSAAIDDVALSGRTSSITAVGGTFAYDGQPHPATGTVTGFGDVVLGAPVFRYNGSATLPTAVGTYEVTASFAGNADFAAAADVATTIVIEPMAFTVAPVIASRAENSASGARVRVADLVATKGGFGSAARMLSGADAASFEVDGTSLYLRSGVALDYERKSAYSVTVTVSDPAAVGASPVSAGYTLAVTDVNEAPTAVVLRNVTASLPENTSTATRRKVADIAVTDDALGTNTLSLSGADAASFEIVGTSLYLRSGVALDYERKSTYSVTVTVSDPAAVGASPVSAGYTLAVTDVNESPTDIALSAAAIAENQPSGTTVGTLSTTDPDTSDTFTYTLVSGSGSTDNVFFTIDGTSLKTAASFNYEAQSSYSIRVRSTDAGGLFTEKTFTVGVTDVVEPLATDHVEPPVARSYRAGEVLSFTLVLTRPVAVTGKPAIDLTLGKAKTQAVYASGSGTNRLVFSYTVKAGDTAPAGVVLGSTIRLPAGARIRMDTTNLPVALPAVNTSGVRVDTTPPKLTGVSGPVAGSLFREGQIIQFTAVVSEPIAVTGQPMLQFWIGSAHQKQATYVAAASSQQRLVFQYTTQAGDNGAVAAKSLSLSGATAVDGAGNRLATAFSPPALPGVAVDTVRPSIAALTAPVAKTYRAGQAMDFTVALNEPVRVSGTPTLPVEIGSAARSAAFVGFVKGSGNKALIFRAIPQAGDLDTDGVRVTGPVNATGATIADLAGNAAILTLPAADTHKILVDGVAPSILSVSGPTLDAKRTSLTVRVTFSEPVVVTGIPRIGFTLGGTARQLTYTQGSKSRVLTFVYALKNTDNRSAAVVLGNAISLAGNAAINDVVGNRLLSPHLP